MKVRLLIAVVFGVCMLAKGADDIPPTIVQVQPAPGTVSTLTNVTVTFSEPIAGLTAADLIINSSPATASSGSNAVFTFYFSQPAPGSVSVNFDGDTAITDLAGNPFNAFATNWTYTIIDSIPPTVLSSTPASNATVTNMTQMEVVFSEPVSGVDAADLRINGQAASSVTPVAPDRYVFSFAQATPGAVTVSWSAGHGIQDLAGNSFGGAGWSCTLNPAAPGDVVINEFLADNLTSLVDADGQKQDWIELWNRGSSSVNLAGWSLSDDPNDPGRWTLPPMSLDTGQYLIVFASGKDRKIGALHSSFGLNVSGGYLGLFNSQFPRQVVSQFDYAEQRGDISYGRGPGGATNYFTTLTPGATNNAASAVTGFAQAPHASADSGLFSYPFDLALSTDTDGASIRYTLDGSQPISSSALYAGPIPIAGTPTQAVVLVRAAAFKNGLAPSTTTTRTYIFPAHVLTQPTNPPGVPAVWDTPSPMQDSLPDYEMDARVVNAGTNRARILQGLASIPTISIVTDPRRMWSSNEGFYVRKTYDDDRLNTPLVQPCNAELIFGDGSREGFNVTAGIRITGGTSPDDQGTFPSAGWKSRKLSMRLMFSGTYGATKLRYQVFDDSPVDEFDTLVLDAGLNNVWSYNGGSAPDDQRRRAEYCRDQFMSDLENALGGTAPHGRHVHVYLNGLYWGLHGLHERPDHRFAASYHGGDSSEYDVFKHNVTDARNVVAGTNVFAVYGQMMTLARSGLTNNAVYEQLQQVLDVPAFADYMIINGWGANTDWPHQNFYASKRRTPDGRWRFHSWDAEHVMEDKSVTVSYNDPDANSAGELLSLLRQNTEFKLLFADHVHRHFFNGGQFYVDPLNPVYDANFPERNRPAALFMQRLNKIYPNPLVAESARWGDTAQTGSPAGYVPLTIETHFKDQLDSLLGIRNVTSSPHSQVWRYFVERSDFSLTQWRNLGLYPTVVAPSFNQHGGLVGAGFNLTMTAPSGTIYYTTNGVDPRVYGSGAVSPQAIAYSGAVAVNSSMIVKARALVGSTWSALTEATFKVGELIPPLRVTEIMYNPVGGDAYEYIELRNLGGLPINLSGYTIQGIGFTFPPGSVYGAGATIVLASDSSPSAFATRYPGVNVAGYFSGRLDNGGERLTILEPRGHTVLSVDYNDANGWPTAADGRGYSLEIVDANGDPDDPANWRASTDINGTPGLPAAALPPPSVILNELMADNIAAVSNANTYPDWIELHNPGASTVNLNGWSLSDDGNPRKFVFPNGTSIAAGGYLIVWCDLPTGAPGLHAGFALGRKDESVFLYDNNTNLVDAISFGPQITDVSMGRISGAWQLTQPTPGAANAALATAPQNALVINEWLANPPPGSGQDDWVELYNTSAQPVALKGIHIGTADALFQLQSLAFIPAHGYVQFIADENPGADHLDLRLAAGGGSIILYDSDGFQLDRINYGAQLEGVTQGRLPDGNSAIRSFPGSSSPSAPNYINTQAGPIFNEVFVANGSQNAWVELLNTNQAPVDLSGLTVNTVRSTLGGWTFGPGTTLAPNAFAVVDIGQALSANGGALYVLSSSGQVLDSLEYGFQIPGMSIGRAAGQWNLLSSATPGAANASSAQLGSAADLKINEWMANPADASEADWFELYNPGADPVRLTGLYVTDNLSINGQTNWPIGPLSFIGASGFVRFEASGDPALGRDHVNFALAGGGEAIRISDAALEMIDTVAFGGQAQGVSQGRIPDGATDIVSFPQTPTPSASNYLPLDNARINEVLPNLFAPAQAAIEIYNPSSSGVDLGGWYLSNDPRNPKLYRIPDGTFLPAGGYLVLQATQFGFPPVGYVSLSEADSAGNMSGRRSVVSFAGAPPNKSFGVVQMCAGLDFAELTSISLGSRNAGPRIGPVVISEIMYHPATLNSNENNIDEYLELHNLTAQDLALDNWELRTAVSFTFPTNTAIPASGFLVVVGFDPTADLAQLIQFRSKFNVPEDAPVVGPWRGNLSNNGESIELYRPGNILVERVVYDDLAPWPTSGDGDGNSIQRTVDGYANDPMQWHAGAPTAGTPDNLVQDGPATIIIQPVSRTVPSGARVEFSVDLCGTAPTGYLWQWDGGALQNASNPSYVINSVSAANAGMYRVAVSNAFGPTTYSEWAMLAIQSPPVITQQPESVLTASGTNVSFTVAASGSGPFTYQWRKNGIALAGMTNVTLDLFDVQIPDSGDYSVLVGNAAGSVASAVANLEVYQRVRILTHPASRTVNTNTAVSFTVTASGTGTLRYQWRYMGQDLQDQTNVTLNISSVQLEDSGEYTVLVSDNRSSAESLPATLAVLVRPTVLRHPQGLIVAAGSNVTLSAGIHGGWPLTNRWRRGSANVYTNILSAKETNTTFPFPNIQTNQAFGYAVGVVNGAGSSLLSSNAFITVVLPPTNTTVLPGADAQFKVQAFGLTRILYQWKSGNTDIVGATNTTLIVSNVQSSQAGTYSVVVSAITNTFIPPATFSATLSVQSTAPVLSEPRLLSASEFQFLLTGESNVTYAIQFSPDLTNWTTFTNVLQSNGSVTVTDPAAATEPRRFYRARGP